MTESGAKPRILVLTVDTWSRIDGTYTFPQLLEDWGAEAVTNICIRDGIPDSKTAGRYFRISEHALLRRYLHPGIPTGAEVFPATDAAYDEQKNRQAHNDRTARLTKSGKTPYFLLLARELLWKCGKWKTPALDHFLDESRPDVILYSLEGYIHFIRLAAYAMKRTGAPAIGYIWDDNFTYKQQRAFGFYLYRFFQRHALKHIARKTDAFFAITPKTKREADAFFHIDAKLLTKPVRSVPAVPYETPQKPRRLLYTGKLTGGRAGALNLLCATLDDCHADAVLDVYSSTPLPDAARACKRCVYHSAVPSEQLPALQAAADILVFLEAIDGAEANIARLSFSTKLTDYFSAGRAILAIGKADIAPMEYLRDEDAACCASSRAELETALALLLQDDEMLRSYAQKARACGENNHSDKKIKQLLYDTIDAVVSTAQTH